jgi:hypothetical protein
MTETLKGRLNQTEAVAKDLQRAWNFVLNFALTALILFGLTSAWSWAGLVPLAKRPAAERPFERL